MMHPGVASTLKAVLVSIRLPGVAERESELSLVELRRLVETLGYEVIETLSQQRPTLKGPTALGEGKLVELALLTGGPGQPASPIKRKVTRAEARRAVPDEAENGEPMATRAPGQRAGIVIFDCDLSPSQLQKIESATAAKVLDRTGVIIEIFSRHARTRAAKLQIEIARLNYTAPRLRESSAGADRQGGGIGGKGAGESSLELDRRKIRDRLKEIKAELESIHEEDEHRRSRRAQEHSVVLVGYTNAGKSSMMRGLTGSEVLIEDKLFATLDTTVRPIHPESYPRILVSDTVGFIRKLPHDLVASFRSTLDEARNASLLLYIVDAADVSFRSQLTVARTVLSEVGAGKVPSRVVLNKTDRLDTGEVASLAHEFPAAILMSARNPEHLTRLRETLISFFEEGMVERELFIPYDTQGLIGDIRSSMRVLNEVYVDLGISMRVKTFPENLARLQKRYDLKVGKTH
ncbi:MAG: GTPase HflX [Candidatus Riflebacteria bacterium]|nr:GTPase HflX [Candidatus Riflebacteria bacterium]